ncbi:unnamed protein product [Rangifer tarandus platyrhynchus]|uniref:Uncharacterized protein n=1 Tax=Rangifer tarandus platyrhynchus TaxID=3082113 RepID=A0AC59Z4K7_RANTA
MDHVKVLAFLQIFTAMEGRGGEPSTSLDLLSLRSYQYKHRFLFWALSPQRTRNFVSHFILPGCVFPCYLSGLVQSRSSLIIQLLLYQKFGEMGNLKVFKADRAWNYECILSGSSEDTSETEPQFPRVVTSSTTHPCVRLPPSLPPIAPLLFPGITSKAKIPEDKYYILMHICGI